MASPELVTITAVAAAAILLLSMCAAPARAVALPRRRMPSLLIPERTLTRLYWHTWDAAWQHLRDPQRDFAFAAQEVGSGAALSPVPCHPCFIAQHMKYAAGVFPAGDMLTGIYASQQSDGFIPPPAGPGSETARAAPLYSWAEWDLHLLTADRARLSQVLPVLMRFHRWIQGHCRTAQGLYCNGSAAACGSADSLGLSCQMALDARCLSLIALEIGLDDAAAALTSEYQELAHAINSQLWSAERGWYGDPGAPGESVTGFWPLLAGIAPADRAEAVVAHLIDPREFWRPTPVPAVAAARSGLPGAVDIGAARAAVWPAANYMVVRGLQQAGRPGLAKTIAVEYLRSLAAQFEAQGGSFERCSPERDWGEGASDAAVTTGVGAISMLIEDVLGLSADARAGVLHWAPRLSVRQGVEKLAMGARTVSVVLAARAPGRDYTIRTDASEPFTLRVVTDFEQGTTWRGKKSLGPLNDGTATIVVRAGASEYRISGEPRPDALPPAQPQHLVATRTNRAARLRWQACADEDLAGYHVYRTEDHGWRKVSAAPCFWSTYVDENPPPGGCCYAVAAVDIAGNTSPMSAPADLGPAGGEPSALTSPVSA